MDPRNYHAEIMQAFAAGDAIRLATLASELASELAAVTSLAESLQVRRQHEAERQRKRYAKTHPHVRSRDVTLSHVTGSPPLDGPPFPSPDPNQTLPLIPSPPLHVDSGESTPRAAAKPSVKDPYSPEFESWWGDYPSDGRGNKRAAWKAWNARLRDGHGPVIFRAGLTRYKAYLATTGRYPKNASTFLGPDLHFLETWELPATPFGGARAKPAANGDEEAARMRLLAAKIDTRRQKSDGPEWWAWVEQAAKLSGATNHRGVLLFAVEHLEDEYVET